MDEKVKEYLGEIGKKGGQAKTKVKVTASRNNGRKGGRPKTYKTTAERQKAYRERLKQRQEAKDETDTIFQDESRSKESDKGIQT